MPGPRETILFYRDSILKTYGQVFFSDHRGFSALLLVVSFVNPYAGISGLMAVIGTIAIAQWFGLNPAITRTGLYSYNALMLGLVMGIYFQFSLAFAAVLLLGTFVTLLLTLLMAVRGAAHKIPFLSLPFILGVWVVLLSTRSLGAISLSERGIYEMNELWSYGGPMLVDFYNQINDWPVPFAFDIYLKSLSAIIFQFNVVSGLIIAIGLVAYSRIAFSLSLIGFYSGYLFYYFVQGNITELQDSYVGFNFILTAFGLGSFFVVPSARSYLLVILTTPLVGLLITALGMLLQVYQLPLYSLPFSLVVIGVVFLLNNRYESKGLPLVTFQQFSPEKNLYSYWNHMERFRNDTYYHIHLPFFGEWRISQGHAGGITHKDDWRFAWDFDIVDETGKTYREPGKITSDFYCYGLPVLAPASGYVATIIDEVEDNEIGEVNLSENWGNTIVIKHGEYLFSKISHIRKGSFKVKEGDYVTKGDTLALCGNSGRSPEPHIHFQIQAAPHVGAKTIAYPISYYLSREGEKIDFHSFEVPARGEFITRPVPAKLLRDAFHFIPGLKFKFQVEGRGRSEVVDWEVFVDSYNQPYIFCHTTRSTAYFVNNETLHYFTSFFGDRNSLLYYFYLGAYKVLLSHYPGLVIGDTFPIEGFYSGPAKYLQDFAAPFYRYLKAKFESSFVDADDLSNPGNLTLQSSATASMGKRIRRRIDFRFSIENGEIKGLNVTENNVCIEAKRLS